MDIIYTVTQINNSADQLLQDNYTGILVSGEISSLKISPNKHAYFTLKDDLSELPCIMFNNTFLRYKDIMNIGDVVELNGSLSLYKARGQYQFKANKAKELGKGDFWAKYEKLKKKLLDEGLFSEKYKKSIPVYLKKIVIVTSNYGAVKTDIINISRKRCSYQDIFIYPVSVQGNTGAQEMTNAIEYINSNFQFDVIILARGGGSIEDLWPFNDENLARAIFKSDIPIISAVGHEIDYTISDFVADKRASTPSDAAEIISIDQEEMLQQIDSIYMHMNNSIKINIEKRIDKVLSLSNKKIIKDPTEGLNILRDRTNNFNDKIHSILDIFINELSIKINNYNSNLLNLNPRNVLNRGYSFMLNTEKIPITSLSEINIGDSIYSIFKDGEVKSEVTEKNEKNIKK